tara:strand:+ start:525 stop:875 length:351 start_codon:yes stop_codon:yes gene_type:complete
MKHEAILKKKYEENIDKHDYDFQRLIERANNDVEEMHEILREDIIEYIDGLTAERYHCVFHKHGEYFEEYYEEPSEKEIEISKEYSKLYDRICSKDFVITFENIRMAHYEYKSINY